MTSTSVQIQAWPGERSTVEGPWKVSTLGVLNGPPGGHIRRDFLISTAPAFFNIESLVGRKARCADLVEAIIVMHVTLESREKCAPTSLGEHELFEVAEVRFRFRHHLIRIGRTGPDVEPEMFR